MASESRLIIVDLVKSLETLHTNTILQLVKEVVKKPNQIKGEQVHKYTYMHRFSKPYLQRFCSKFLPYFVTFSTFVSIRIQAW